jgi:hypothetical protein
LADKVPITHDVKVRMTLTRRGPTAYEQREVASADILVPLPQKRGAIEQVVAKQIDSLVEQVTLFYGEPTAAVEAEPTKP